jgi:hypothetical protein
MKNILFFTLILVVVWSNANSQQCLPSGGCTIFRNQYPDGITYTPTTTWTTHGFMSPGNYTLFYVTSGITYEWTYCEDYGGVSTFWDPQMTLYNNSNLSTPLCFSTDVCGPGPKPLAPYISWKANFTGVARILTTQYSSKGCLTALLPTYNTLAWRRLATASAAVGDLLVTVKNINGGSLPSGTLTVDLYNSSNTPVDSKTSTSGGVTFSNVPSGSNYSYKVYFASNPSTTYGQEYWGTKTGVTVNANMSTPSSFNRNMPYSDPVKVYNGSTEVTGQTVAAGTTLTVKQVIQNPSGSSQSVQGDVNIDISKSTPYDLPLSWTSSSSVSSEGKTNTWTIKVPSTTGSYYYITGVKTSGEITDGWRWQSEPLFKVTAASVNSLMEVPFYTQGNSEWCWAASTSMLLKYYGFNRKIWEIAADFDKAKNDMINPYAIGLDSYLETYYGDGSGKCWKVESFWIFNNFKESLISIINSGRPVIIFSIKLKHAFVVTGISGTGLNDLVYFHDSGTILADKGITKGNQVNNSITWQNFEELINKGLSIDNDVSLCYVNSGHLQKSTGKLSFQINPSQIVFQNSIGLTGNEMRMIFLDWDGKEPFYGYKYVKSKPNDSWYPEDSHLGYKATQGDKLFLIPYISNSSISHSQVICKVILEIIDNLGKVVLTKQSENMTIPGNGKKDGDYYYPSFTNSGIELKDFAPGNYRCDLKLINAASNLVEDKMSIQFAIAPNSIPSGVASVSLGVALSPATVISGNSFTTSFTLKETKGLPIDFETIVCGITNMNNTWVRDMEFKGPITLPANGTLNYSSTLQWRTTDPTGSYRAWARGKVAGGDWIDFTVAGGVNPKEFQVISNVSNPGSFSLTLTPECYIGTDSQIRLNWTESANATSYEIYRDGSLYFPTDGSKFTGTQFENRGSKVLAGTSYSYYVKAINSAGGTNSSTKSATAPDCSSTPTLNPARNLTVSAGDGKVTLNWSAPSSGSPNSYRVFYSTSENGIYVAITSNINSLNETIPGFTNGIKYWFYVVAYYSAGSSNPSNIVSATPSSSASCTTPTNQASAVTFSSVSSNSMTLFCSIGNGSRRVVKINKSNSFTAPASGTDPTANTNYSGSGEQVVYNGTGNLVTITGLTAGTTYWFRVYEANCSGSSSLYYTATGSNNPNSQSTITSSCTAPITSVNSPSGSSPLTMTCTATGGSGGSIAYKWYSGTSCSGTVLGTGSTLAVTANGYYSCKAYIVGNESTCYNCATGYATIMAQTCTNWSVSPSTQSVPSSGGSYQAQVFASGSCSYNLTFNNAWIHFVNYPGSGGFAYSVDANNTGNSRTGTVSINNATDGINDSTTLTIVQDVPCSLFLSSNMLDFTSSSGNNTVNVSSNSSWTVNDDASWITVSQTSGSNNATLTISVSNNSGAKRNGTVTVSGCNTTKTITVIQAGTCSLSLSKPSLDFTSSSGNNTVNVSSNSSWTVNDDASWITVSQTSGSNNATLTISVSNNSGAERSGTVTVSGCNTTKTITVIQVSECILSLDISNLDFSTSPGGKSFKVNSNSSWTASADSSWISVLPVASSGNKSVVISVKENNGVSRVGIVTFSGCNQLIYLAINQDGKTTAIGDVIVQGQVKVYPNPTTGIITIEGLPENENVEIAIYDINRKLIKKQTASSSVTKMDISNVVSGTYLLIIDELTDKTFKIMKE